MPAGRLGAAALAELVAEFEGAGVVTLQGALSIAEVGLLRETFAANRARLPLNWTLRGKDQRGGPTGESGRWQSDELLRTDTAALALVPTTRC